MLKEYYVIVCVIGGRCVSESDKHFEKYPSREEIIEYLQNIPFSFDYMQFDYMQVEKRYVLESPVRKKRIVVVAKHMSVAWDYLKHYAYSNKELIASHKQYIMTSNTCEYIAMDEGENKFRGKKFDEAWVNADVAYGFVKHIIQPTLPSDEALKLFGMSRKR